MLSIYKYIEEGRIEAAKLLTQKGQKLMLTGDPKKHQKGLAFTDAARKLRSRKPLGV